ncbi:glycosyltransferase family 39 protein [Edaphobacter sp.]|uniref:ArnT family glycosyltransferase n=1 Tax=Edaphobacter sp. TaxID=1934404 RepID=UPI002DB595C6|nr:glycosyltransferase family 39 protein [Edaphobacter sp.]HEU5339912.1 glycosyltransferase family 39 protein [Edaphobacter sp.]
MTNSTLSKPLDRAETRVISAPRRSTALAILTGLWLIIFFSALFSPPLLDDADATHSNAARYMVQTGDLVTLHVNGVRYLEKAPLPYWLVAASFRVFGFNTFAAHLPQAIGVLLLALLGFRWASRAFDDRTAFYTGLGILTSAGVFLFTRVFIPEVLLTLFLCGALYCLLRALEAKPGQSAKYAYMMWALLALAVLTKGLVALVFFGGAGLVYLTLTGGHKRWGTLKPFTGTLLFLAIAAPWHILAGLRNTGGMNGHGFFWFYFVNEHFLRFLGKRYPKDYNKLPGYLFWSLHIVWLFPWSLFIPAAVVVAVKRWKSRAATLRDNLHTLNFKHQTTLLLALYSALVLVFFSISTNQEYYTFPAYLALLILIAAALVRAEDNYAEDKSSRRWITFAHAAFAVVGIGVSLTLAYGLWRSRHLPFVPDIGDLLAHRDVGDYTLSMSHLFDLTDASFAALRLPAALAAITFAVGPAIAWLLRSKRRHLAATTAIALTSTVFLVAAHIAFVRFGTMMSSENFAQKIQQLEAAHAISPDSEIMLYGDQAYGSSIPFYLGKMVYLVEGRSTSMLFGSTFPDAPHIFLTNRDLIDTWGHGPRKVLFVPLEKRDAVDQLLGNDKVLLLDNSGKALYTDRPLDH